MTISEFLLARIAEDEELARAAIEPKEMHPYGDVRIPAMAVDEWPDAVRGYLGGPWGEHAANSNPTRVLAECAAKRAIVKQHEEWPVLIERPPIFDTGTHGADYISYQVTQQIAWTTEREYVKRFGTEPPTAPMLRTLAAVYADHPDYQKEWSDGAGS